MSLGNEYFNQVNQDLLEMVLLNSPSTGEILEVGCGTGRLGAACRAHLKSSSGVKYLGVEINADAAEQARMHLTEVVSGNIEDDEVFSRLKSNRFQLFVFGDVLEHLVDPWRVLRSLHGLAHPHARIVACIPNLQHWTLIKTLLSGNWPYSDDGLLDRTHLRFFTLNSAIDLFKSTGWNVKEVRGRTAGQDGRKFFDDIRPAIERLRLDTTQFERNASVVQFLITAEISEQAEQCA